MKFKWNLLASAVKKFKRKKTSVPARIDYTPLDLRDSEYHERCSECGQETDRIYEGMCWECYSTDYY